VRMNSPILRVRASLPCPVDDEEEVAVTLRRNLPLPPPRIARLPLDERGYPVPWFVGYVDDKPDFRLIGEGKIGDAIRFERCWLCGQRMGRNAAFVAGPMCAVNRTSAEPPSHWECADYAVRACPFLTMPKMERREGGLPAHAKDPAGVMLRRNPGAILIWLSRTWKPFRPPDGGVLFDIGDPVGVHWFVEGRPATRAEVEASLESGLPALMEMAQEEGARAVAELERRIAEVRQLVPR
jgi:hypothetical protein